MHDFVVIGVGQFPIDMLRSDVCFPKTEDDSAEIEKSFRRQERNEHTVKLTSSMRPDAAHWRSFGYKLIAEP
jgi:hypothetical protein